MKQLVINVRNLKISNDLPFVLIAGPDSIESENHALFMAREIKKITTKVGKPYPDGYIEAIEHLHSTSDSVIILEDSNDGIKSAKICANWGRYLCREHVRSNRSCG